MAEGEQRQKRFRIALPLRIRIRQRLGMERRAKEENVVVEETITENISTTGCYFLLSKKPPVGSSAEMEIAVPGHYLGVRSGRVHCRGKIVRVEDRHGGKRAGVACTIDSYSLHPPAPK